MHIDSANNRFTYIKEDLKKNTEVIQRLKKKQEQCIQSIQKGQDKIQEKVERIQPDVPVTKQDLEKENCKKSR